MKKNILNHFAVWQLILLALIFPLIFTLTWLMRNTQLPANDAANYLSSAIYIFHHFTQKNIWSGLVHLYTGRGWRPIIFPNLTAIVLLLSWGNLFVTYYAISVMNLMLSGMYIFLLLRLKLDKLSTVIATSIICLLPLIQAQILMFYAEGTLFFCLMGTLYHLIQSDYFRNVKHTIGFVLLFSLALMIRPVEAVTHLIFVLSFFLFNGWKQGFFPTQKIMLLFLMGLSALSIFFTGVLLPHLAWQPLHLIDDGGLLDHKMQATIRYAFLSSVICAWLMLMGMITVHIKYFYRWYQRRIQNTVHNPLLLPAFFMIFGLTLWWFLPFAAATFEWIYRTSLGDVANSTGSLTGSHFSWPELHKYILAEGTLMVGAIIATSVVSLFLLEKEKIIALVTSPVFYYLLLMAPFPFWEAFYTVQVVTRKLSVAFPALLMAFLMLSLQAGRWFNLRQGIVGGLLLVQFLLSICLVFPQAYQSQFLKNTVGFFIPAPTIIHPNPHDVVMAFIMDGAKQHHYHAIGLQVDPGTPDARHPVDAEPIDPFLLSTLMQANDEGYNAGYPYFSLYSDKNVKQLHERFDAIFLADKIENMQQNVSAAKQYQRKFLNEQSASLKTFYDMLIAYSKNQLSQQGWQLGPCTIIKTQKHGDYRGCLLLSI